MRVTNTKTFIIKANIKHDNFYNYKNVKYIDSKTEVEIICPSHGEFNQSPRNHLLGYRCKECAGIKPHTNDSFIKKSNKIHNNFYDYSNVNYINNRTKVTIVCPMHDEFEQPPRDHLSGHGCKKCADKQKEINMKSNTIDFITKSKKVHGDKYDYSKTIYVDVYAPITIICDIHKEFTQNPNDHLNGCGCPSCGGTTKLTTKTFIEKANIVHDNYFDYSNVNYITNRALVKIICPKHGEFEQIPNSHLLGHNGCDSCSTISTGENKIEEYLLDNNIKYQKQYKFSGCINKKKLPFDFYLPNNNICIEYDGIQHFESVKYFGGDEKLEYTKKNDSIKNKYCEENNVNLLRIKYNQFNNITSILNGILLV